MATTPTPAARTLVVGPSAFRVIDFGKQAQLDLCFDWSQTTWLTAITSYTLSVPSGLTIEAESFADKKVTVTLKFTDPTALYEGQLFDVECEVITNDTPPLSDTRSITVRAVSR